MNVLVFRKIAKQAVQTKMTLPQGITSLDLKPLTKEQIETLNHYINDCQKCGLWCYPEDICNFEGTQVCQRCEEVLGQEYKERIGTQG